MPRGNVRFPPIADIERRGHCRDMLEEIDWSRLTDASGQSYDPRPALEAIRTGAEQAGYDELWERVHHQGDVGTAAYAIVPDLVLLMTEAPSPDWRAYALIATAEEARCTHQEPSVPDFLEPSYRAAMRDVVSPALRHLQDATHDLDVRSALSVLAYAKDQPTIGAIALWTDDERREALGEG